MKFKFTKYCISALFVTVIPEITIWAQLNIIKNDSLNSVAEITNVYSTLIIDESNFNEGYIVSPYELIAGKIPGVTIVSNSGTPGSSFSITTNSLNTFSNAESPVVVVNGIPVYNTTVWLHPHEIESITFYKNAGALGYYNDKASNSALIIQTKKGSDKISAQYNGTLALSFMPEKVDVLTASEYRRIVSEHLDSTYNIGNSDTDWQNEIFQQAISQDHHLGLGGTIPYLNLPVRVSAGKTIHEGIIKTSKLDRTTTSLALTPDYFDNHLALNFNFDYNDIKNNLANENTFRSACQMNPTYTADEYNAMNFFNYVVPPTDLLNQTNSTDNNKQYNTLIGIDYRLHFLPDLHIGMNYSRQKTDKKYEFNADTAAHYLYTKEITKQNSLNKLLTTSVGYMHVNPANKNYIKIAFTQYLYDYETTTEEERYSSFGSSYKKNSFTSELNFGITSFDYGVHNKYFINLYFRNEKNAVYSENENIISSWGGGLAWKLSEEKFLTSQPWINNLTLRTSLKVPVAEGDANSPSTQLNEEKQRYYDVGVVYSLFGNKIKGYVQYIDKNNTELHQTIIVPSGSSFSNTITVNIGEVISRGAELYFSSLVLSSNKIHWNISTHFSYSTSKIEKLTNQSNPQFIGTLVGKIGGTTISTIQILQEEQAPYAFFALQQVYDANGQPMEGLYADLMPDGTIDYDDFRVFSQITPKIIMGLSSEFKYNDWEFYFSGRLHAGQSVYNNKNSISYYQALYYSNVTSNVEESNFNTAQIRSDYYVENATFFRMDYIGVAYVFQSLVNGMGALKINATLQNAFTITSYSGIDPEVTDGIDYYEYPRARVFSLGLQLGF